MIILEDNRNEKQKQDEQIEFEWQKNEKTIGNNFSITHITHMNNNRLDHSFAS